MELINIVKIDHVLVFVKHVMDLNHAQAAMIIWTELDHYAYAKINILKLQAKNNANPVPIIVKLVVPMTNAPIVLKMLIEIKSYQVVPAPLGITMLLIIQFVNNVQINVKHVKEQALVALYAEEHVKDQIVIAIQVLMMMV